MAVAYCWATGMIEIGGIVPDGAIPLAFGDAQALHDVVGSLATLAYDNKTLCIPGFALVGDDNARLDLVFGFSEIIRENLR